MAVLVTHCVGCGNSLERSTELVKSHAVVRCPRCKWYGIEGDGVRFHDADHVSRGEMVQALRERGLKLERSRQMDVNVAAVFDSESSDPRWGS